MPSEASVLMYATITTSPTLSPLQAPIYSDNAARSSGLSSAAYSPRPGLSRSTSVSSMYLGDADDSFAGLTLLDLFVALDSHLDLASREIKRKGQEWRSKAESTAISVKRQAEEVLTQQRRLRKRANAGRQSDPRRTQGEESDEDVKVDIDRELAKFRARLQGRISTVREKWKDQRVVSLRDKLSFFFGVELVLFSALLVGFRPQWIPGVYTALSAYLFPIRIYEYRKKQYSLFLYDLCYIVNILCLAYIWIWPQSTILFVACYCLSHGPLCTAIATWRNSLVFHSVDKTTSLFIHMYPPFVFTVLRHFYPNAEAKYPALTGLQHMSVWQSLLFSSVAYLTWQVGYYYGVMVARKEEIEKKGRVTSFTYMLNNKRSLIGKTLAKIPAARREMSFMIGQYVYTIVTMAPSVIWLWDSKFLSCVWLLLFFSVSVWNGASFYFKVMSNSKEVASLRKELEDLQKEIDGRKTPASQASLGPESVDNFSLGPSAVNTPNFGPVDSPGTIISPLPTSETISPSIDSAMGTPSVESNLERASSSMGSKIPVLKLDEGEGSQNGSNDAESDSSAVVVDAEDGKPAQS